MKNGVLFLILMILVGCSNSTQVVNDKVPYSLEQGMVTFIFDDGHHSFYDNAFPLFENKGFVAAVAIDTKRWEAGGEELMTTDEINEMQDAGWEIMSHSVSHKDNTKWRNSFGWIVEKELKGSKETLENYGFEVNQYVAPMSAFPLDKHKDLLRQHYQAGYTTYINSKEEPVNELIMTSPLDIYELHRANMEGKSIEELKEYIDYAVEKNGWIVLYEHQIGGEEKYTTTETLEELLNYIETTDIHVLTGTQAIDIIKSNVE